MTRGTVGALACVLGLGFSAGTAAADPITVSSGYLDVDSGGGPLVLAGSLGFSLSTIVATASGFVASVAGTFEPGATVSLRADWSGNDLLGTAYLDGQEYAHLGSDSAWMGVFFGGTAVLPAVIDGDATVALAPFALTGYFSYAPSGTTGVRTDLLSGSGTATLRLVRAGGTNIPAWSVRSIRYDFESPSHAPVPEPSTLALMALGGVALAAARRRNV